MNKMKNIALITAKGGNTSIENKNLIEIHGRTFLGWQLKAAEESKYIDDVFVSTECPLIKKEAEQYGAYIIDRPKELAQAFTNHGDAILHGVREAKKILNQEIGIVTILLGNVASNKAEDIDMSIEALINDKNADSSMTVWRAQDDHPFRAMKIDSAGYLGGYLDLQLVDTNRQSYPDIYFYDQGPWNVRYTSIIESQKGITGPACWWWMGNRCIPIIRNWVTGRDVHTQLDVEIAKSWIENELWKY